MIVKQKTTESPRVTLRLREYMDSSDGWGVEEGRFVHARLLEVVESHIATRQISPLIFIISLEGVRRTDASFPRESVMQLAHRFRTQHGFCLRDLNDPVLLENWEAAAIRRAQPILLWREEKSECRAHLLGPKLSEGLRSVFEFLLLGARKSTEEVAEFVTAEVAARLEMSVPNASNKLKTLWTEAYIMRREQTAPSGGIEFRYFLAS